MLLLVRKFVEVLGVFLAEMVTVEFGGEDETSTQPNGAAVYDRVPAIDGC